jgi:glycosyltransferase involved in cell wall biosynthesis
VDIGAPTHLHSEPLDLAPDRWLRLPVMPSFSAGLRHTRRCRQVLRDLEARTDLLLVQLPFQTTPALLSPRSPRAYHLFADVVGMAASSTAYAGPRRLVARAYGAVVDAMQRRLVRRADARLVANGQALVDHYGCGRAVVSATISEADLAAVQRSRTGGPWRILCVANLRHEKGIDVLLDAFGRLPEPCELVLVGPGEPDDLGEEVAGLLRSLVESGRLRLVGPVEFGPTLFQHYADADVFVLPSRSEATPRVLVEARAFGCPVVATRVGGVPTSVDDGIDGLLVPPQDAAALAAALQRVHDDGDLRAALVAAGRERARRHTVEAFTAVLADELEALVPLVRSSTASGSS